MYYRPLLLHTSYTIEMKPIIIDTHRSHQWSTEDLFIFCSANKNLRIERNMDQHIIFMSPLGDQTS